MSAEHAPVHRSADAARAWRGAALFSRGFRPFFLGAGVWAAVGMALWPAVFSGTIAIPTAFTAVDWHAHEMIFGYGGAVVAGFLLTAIPNWTGRLPVAGRRSPAYGLRAGSPCSPPRRSAGRLRRRSMLGSSSCSPRSSRAR